MYVASIVNLQILLLSDLEEFYRFIDELVLPADTRGDRAESVFAGLDAMLNLSWQKLGTKVDVQTDIRFCIYQPPIFIRRCSFI